MLKKLFLFSAILFVLYFSFVYFLQAISILSRAQYAGAGYIVTGVFYLLFSLSITGLSIPSLVFFFKELKNDKMKNLPFILTIVSAGLVFLGGGMISFISECSSFAKQFEYVSRGSDASGIFIVLLSICHLVVWNTIPLTFSIVAMVFNNIAKVKAVTAPSTTTEEETDEVEKPVVVVKEEKPVETKVIKANVDSTVVLQRIKELRALLDANAITQEEYDQLKADELNRY